MAKIKSLSAVTGKQGETSSAISDKAWQNLVELAGDGGDAVITELVGIFQTQARTWARDLRAAIQKRDTAAVGALCHSLKSSAAGVGAATLSRLTAEMESTAHSGKIEWNSDSFSRIENALEQTTRELSRRLDDFRRRAA